MNIHFVFDFGLKSNRIMKKEIYIEYPLCFSNINEGFLYFQNNTKLSSKFYLVFWVSARDSRIIFRSILFEKLGFIKVFQIRFLYFRFFYHSLCDSQIFKFKLTFTIFSPLAQDSFVDPSFHINEKFASSLEKSILLIKENNQ
jgi:hypothetical protein